MIRGGTGNPLTILYVSFAKVGKTLPSLPNKFTTGLPIVSQEFANTFLQIPLKNLKCKILNQKVTDSFKELAEDSPQIRLCPSTPPIDHPNLQI